MVVSDLNPDAVRACTDIGATLADSVADLAVGCGVVMTSLASPSVVEEVRLGKGGIAEHARPGTVFIDFSTSSLAGIELRKLDSVIRNASGISSGYASRSSKTLAGDLKARFALDLAHEDLRPAPEMADGPGVPGLIAPQVISLMRMARGMGLVPCVIDNGW